jgi:hypothetical protein
MELIILYSCHYSHALCYLLGGDGEGNPLTGALGAEVLLRGLGDLGVDQRGGGGVVLRGSD